MYVLLFPLAATTVLPFELALLSIICFRELWVAGSEEEVFSTLISGASRAITLSAIQVTHVVFTMQRSRTTQLLLAG